MRRREAGRADRGGRRRDEAGSDRDRSRRQRRCCGAGWPRRAADYEGTMDADPDAGPRGRDRKWARRRSGIGMPGTISPATGLVKNANSTWLNGRPFGRDLSRVLDRELRLANDANCLALSEATDGAAAGGSPVFAVILGTGCRRRARRRRADRRRRQRDCRGVGAQSGAVAERRRVAGPTLLLRPHRVHRDAALGARAAKQDHEEQLGIRLNATGSSPRRVRRCGRRRDAGAL